MSRRLGRGPDNRNQFYVWRRAGGFNETGYRQVDPLRSGNDVRTLQQARPAVRFKKFIKGCLGGAECIGFVLETGDENSGHLVSPKKGIGSPREPASVRPKVCAYFQDHRADCRTARQSLLFCLPRCCPDHVPGTPAKQHRWYAPSKR